MDSRGQKKRKATSTKGTCIVPHFLPNHPRSTCPALPAASPLNCATYTSAGTGYSVSGSEVDIPTDMAGMSQDLYEGLWVFFNTHKELQERPLFITGESYAGASLLLS